MGYTPAGPRDPALEFMTLMSLMRSSPDLTLNHYCSKQFKPSEIRTSVLGGFTCHRVHRLLTRAWSLNRLRFEDEFRKDIRDGGSGGTSEGDGARI